MKPILMMVDDDPEVLAALERDLRRQYGKEYRILKATSGAEGLSLLERLKKRREPIALLLSDHRMGQMSGIEFLEEAMKIIPQAKRVLLTAYADTDAAIRAINVVKLDAYLLKPWEPPQERLYPVLSDLLDDWQANYRPPFTGLQILGHRWSPFSHEIKDFLARNHVPYQWLDLETDPQAQTLLATLDQSALDVPVILLQDGTSLIKPTISELATAVGLRAQANEPFYDLIVIGAGPAGLAAAVYGASEGLRTAVIEREAPGGQAGMSSRIENYLGFPVGLSGGDLARRAVTQAKRFGAELLVPQEVTKLTIDGNYRTITLADGSQISCHALLIATGVSYRKLTVPGIEQLTGSGIYYGAATTEAIYCQGQDVYIVGGANSAGQAAVYFSRYASNVILLVRGDSLSKGMSQYLIKQIEETPNIKVRVCTQVKSVQGENHLDTITIVNIQDGKEETLPAAGLFIFIGAMPGTDWLAGLLERDAYGFLLTGPYLMHEGRRPRGWQLDRDPYFLESNVPGIFVAGDVRSGSIKRVASGVGEGAIAVSLIHQYLQRVH